MNSDHEEQTLPHVEYISDEAYNAIMEYAEEHQMSPSDVVESALRMLAALDVIPGFAEDVAALDAQAETLRRGAEDGIVLLPLSQLRLHE